MCRLDLEEMLYVGQPYMEMACNYHGPYGADGKQWGEWYFMKDPNVTVKKIYKSYFCTIVKRSGFH